MIIPNGTIETKVKTAGGINPATGYPAANSGVSWGAPVPCQWQAVSRNYIGTTEGGVFTLASYTVLVEWPVKQSIGDILRLKDGNGNEIGEFSVLNTEELPAVCQTRITLK